MMLLFLLQILMVDEAPVAFATNSTICDQEQKWERSMSCHSCLSSSSNTIAVGVASVAAAAVAASPKATTCSSFSSSSLLLLLYLLIAVDE